MYCPEWTNLEPSDPGVALVELFAWLVESLSFRLNQVPDAFYTRMLDLMGVQPFPPRAARADLTFLLAPDVTDEILVPRGTKVTTSGREPVVFATTDDLVVRQPTLIASLTGGTNDNFTDAWAPLHDPHSGASCFMDPAVPGNAFYLGFGGSLAGSVIQLDLGVSLVSLGVDPSDPPVQWEVSVEGTWISAMVLHDETGGFARAGAITLLIPAANDPLTLRDTRAYWLRARLLSPRPDQPTYASSPRITSLAVCTIGGTVGAEHSQSMLGEVLGISDGRAGQRYTTRTCPVLRRDPGETIRTFADYSTLDWQEVAGFMDSGAHDLHFTWDDASGEVRFGPSIRYADGTVRQHGAIPPTGATVTATEYRHGGGSAGNVGAQTLSVISTPIAGVDRVMNVQRAVGGVDAETVENAKQRGPMTLRSGHQAVTGDDYERLALEADPSIARVRCLPPIVSGQPARLLVVPHILGAPGAVGLDDFALPEFTANRLRDVIETRRILGATIEIGTPFYQGVSVAALLTARPGHPPQLIRQRAAEAISRYLDPVVGGRDGSGWPFDEALRDHAIFRLLESIEGVERVDDVALFEVDLRAFERVGFAKNSIELAPDSLFLSFVPQVVAR